MDSRIPDIVRSLTDIEGTEPWWGACLDVLKSHGVESVCYGAAPFASALAPTPADLVKAAFIKTTHPTEWSDLVRTERLLEHELTAQAAFSSTEPVFWGDVHLQEDATPEQRRFFEIETDLGLDVGVTLPLRGVSRRGVVSCIGLSTPDVGAEEFDAYWRASRELLSAVASIIDHGLCGSRSDGLVRLAPREREILTLIAIGHRPAEIAWRLGVTVKRINNAIEDAKRKLGARTRDHAIAKALRFELIDP